jgi:hypothetical protein
MRSALVRLIGLCALALLAACAGQPSSPRTSERQEAVRYEAHAARTYTPPGPPEDPWRPYIAEAAVRFDVPERWIREVMHVESGGQEFINGALTTSPVGAMGLMQVMPQTYDGLRARYGLGEDAYDPRNNILAGAAYLREMYDLYGTPAFLAAYNAGPQRLDSYLANTRPLPEETRHYVAMIAPYIQDSFPQRRAPAEALALNQLPADIPPGLRYPPARRETRFAKRMPPASPRGNGSSDSEQLIASTLGGYAARPATPAPAAKPAASHGFRLISAAAAAEPLPLAHPGRLSGGWAIQVGAFGNAAQARDAARAAQARLHGPAQPAVGLLRQAHGMLYRARLTGFSRESALGACERLAHAHAKCIVLSPDAQS